MLRLAAVVCSCALLVTLSPVGCSSSDDPGPASSAGAGGSAGTGGGAGTNTAGAAGSSAAGSAGAAGQTPTPPSGTTACSVAVTGAVSYPTTDAPLSCGNSVGRPESEGQGYEVVIGMGFQGPAGETVTVGCTFGSPTPPQAGATWTMAEAPESQAQCEVDVLHGSKLSEWRAASNDTSLTGSASVVFVSATATPGKYQPDKTFYTFEANVTATLKNLTSDGGDVTITAHINQTGLPIGS